MIKRLQAWAQSQEQNTQFIVVCACIIGIGAGFGAFVLKRIIHLVAKWLMTGLGHIPLEWHGGDWWLLILPLIGILLAVAYQKWIARANMVHSTAHIVEYLNSKDYSIPGKMIYDPIVACGITLGFGGSAGAEGPIAYAGAAMGSRLGNFLKLDGEHLRILIGIGAGAGIAGIFKSPIAGVLFTLEVLQMNMAAGPVIGLIMACVCASITCFAFTGTHLYLPFELRPEHGVPMGWVALLGVFCGIYAVVYNNITIWMRRFFKSRRRQWVAWISSGIFAGISLLLFPCIYGEGYPVMTELINGNSDILKSGLMAVSNADAPAFLWMLGLLLLVKAFATVCTNSGGGVAGDFAPTLFAGAIAGTFFALAAKHLFGIELSVPLCALFGTGAAFSGIIHAPVMGIFLCSEISGAFEYILPITICAASAYITVRLINPTGRYIETHYPDFLSIFRKGK